LVARERQIEKEVALRLVFFPAGKGREQEVEIIEQSIKLCKNRKAKREAITNISFFILETWKLYEISRQFG